jgi:hypothetical protein
LLSQTFQKFGSMLDIFSSIADLCSGAAMQNVVLVAAVIVEVRGVLLELLQFTALSPGHA